jgi:hypothetical protein
MRGGTRATADDRKTTNQVPLAQFRTREVSQVLYEMESSDAWQALDISALGRRLLVGWAGGPRDLSSSSPVNRTRVRVALDPSQCTSFGVCVDLETAHTAQRGDACDSFHLDLLFTNELTYSYA